MKPRTRVRPADGDGRTAPTVLPFIALIHGYRLLIAPLLAPRCRFHPTCSEYALDAYRRHGAWRGSVLTVRRLLRCHPWGGSGYDPVPEPRRQLNA